MQNLVTEELVEPFQSLIGLKINWNQGLSNPGESLNLFQSLIGLKINWNLEQALRLYEQGELFQSLIGLKINWNQKIFTLLIGKKSVSIPNRA